MTQKKRDNPLLRLTLPGAAMQRLRKGGIYCSPGVTIEFQQATKRHVWATVDAAFAKALHRSAWERKPQ